MVVSMSQGQSANAPLRRWNFNQSSSTPTDIESAQLRKEVTLRRGRTPSQPLSSHRHGWLDEMAHSSPRPFEWHWNFDQV